MNRRFAHRSQVALRIAALLATVLLVDGCSAYNAEFTQAQCEAFVDRYLGFGGNSGNQDLPAEQWQDLRRTGIRDCQNRTLGVNQAEFDCAMRAGTRDEFAACGITLRG